MKSIAAGIGVGVLILISSITCLAEDPSPYLLSTLARRFSPMETLQGEKVEIMIRVITHTDIDLSNRRFSIAYALKYHDLLCKALQKRGWHVIHPLSEKTYAGPIEITFEPRKKRTVIKTYLYVCGNDPLWNTVKYRGGSYEKYFDGIADKIQECIKTKYHVVQ